MHQWRVRLPGLRGGGLEARPERDWGVREQGLGSWLKSDVWEHLRGEGEVLQDLCAESYGVRWQGPSPGR